MIDTIITHSTSTAEIAQDQALLDTLLAPEPITESLDSEVLALFIVNKRNVFPTRFIIYKVCLLCLRFKCNAFQLLQTRNNNSNNDDRHRC